MSLSISPTLAIASCNLHVDAIDVGTANAAGYFIIYSGDMPDELTDPIVSGDNDALIRMDMDATAFGAAADVSGDLVARATANAVADQPADLPGTATFYRQFSRDDVPLWQGNVTAPNLGGDMEISNTTVVAGVDVVLLSYVFDIPYGTNS